MPLNNKILVRASDSFSEDGNGLNGRKVTLSLGTRPGTRDCWDGVASDDSEAVGGGFESVYAEKEQAKALVEQLRVEVHRLRMATTEGARRDDGDLRLTELAKKAKACVAERDALIDRLRGQAQANAAEIERWKQAAAAALTGSLSHGEAQARLQYESGRVGTTTLWALLMVRSLPAIPLIALLIFVLTDTVAAVGSPGPGKLYLLASVAALAAAGFAILCGVVLQWLQLGPRWIWLRRVNAQPMTFETLTSGGEGLVMAPENFVVELSPLMYMLGLGVVRRCDNGQKYVTSEPGEWLRAAGASRARRRLGLDLITLLSLAGWVALVIGLSFRA